MNDLEKNRVENAEMNREGKEKAPEEAEKKMAARERVEVVGREVKSTKQQIQNIMGNMQAVVKAVAAIRAQLQVAQNDNNIPSVKQDAHSLETLKKKLAGLNAELKDLRGALLTEQRKNIQEENPGLSAEEITQKAVGQVAEMWERLGLGKE